MGFPVGYKNSFSLKLILFSFLLFAIILLPFFYFLRFLGLPFFQDPSFEPFNEYPTRAHHDATINASAITEFLPAARFGDAAVSDETTCAICLSEFKVGEEIRWLRNCKHVFHRGCVDRWIDQGPNSCPLCRAPLVPRHLQDEMKL